MTKTIEINCNKCHNKIETICDILCNGVMAYFYCPLCGKIHFIDISEKSGCISETNYPNTMAKTNDLRRRANDKRRTQTV